MKIIFPYLLLFALLLQIMFSSCTSYKRNFYFSEVPKTNYNLPGQTAPPDMVFIKGNDTIPSFYMGITEEPNINYVIYLQWLSRVYLDYPQIILDALPKRPGDSMLQVIDEPFISGYLTNPAYAFYPVVNLTWEQVQNYLQWKTDRLNESILRLNGFETYSLTQSHEQNFNTEAFVHGQYWLSGTYKYTRSFNSGILFTGYRLPTEGEFDCALSQLKEINNRSEKSNEKVPKYLFSENYFLYHWKHIYGEPLNGIRRFIAYPLDTMEIPFKNFEVSTTIREAILNYPTDYYGVIKFSPNVKEWVLDEYHPSPLYGLNWVQVLDSGGFAINPDTIVNIYSNMQEKDSLGMMPYRIMGVANGEPIRVSLHTDGQIRERVVKEASGARLGLREDEYDPNVGFRCVLPYTGTPVMKGYKVKWK
jgi:formylglycine-generating enzyme